MPEVPPATGTVGGGLPELTPLGSAAGAFPGGLGGGGDESGKELLAKLGEIAEILSDMNSKITTQHEQQGGTELRMPSLRMTPGRRT